MGNGQSSTALAAIHNDITLKKRSCSANVSPRKVADGLDSFLPLETLEDSSFTFFRNQRTPSPTGRRSLELALSPRKSHSVAGPRSCKVSTVTLYSERSPSISSNNQNIAPEFRRKPSAPVQRRRLSVEESQSLSTRRLSRTGKLSLASKEELMSSRRVSRAATHFTETGDFGLTLVEQLKLTSYQILMIQQSWPKIKPNVMAPVFRQLASRNAKAKELFQKMSIVGGFSAAKCCDMKEHVRCLIELFDLALAELNNPSKAVQDKCIQIGEVHFNMCGDNAATVWDDLGNCLIETISKAEPVRGKREALKAWISLISFLMDSMRGGYLAQCKRKSISRPMANLSLHIAEGSEHHCPASPQ